MVEPHRKVNTRTGSTSFENLHNGIHVLAGWSHSEYDCGHEPRKKCINDVLRGCAYVNKWILTISYSKSAGASGPLRTLGTISSCTGNPTEYKDVRRKVRSGTIFAPYHDHVLTIYFKTCIWNLTCTNLSIFWAWVLGARRVHDSARWPTPRCDYISHRQQKVREQSKYSINKTVWERLTLQFAPVFWNVTSCRTACTFYGEYQFKSLEKNKNMIVRNISYASCLRPLGDGSESRREVGHTFCSRNCHVVGIHRFQYRGKVTSVDFLGFRREAHCGRHRDFAGFRPTEFDGYRCVFNELESTLSVFTLELWRTYMHRCGGSISSSPIDPSVMTRMPCLCAVTLALRKIDSDKIFGIFVSNAV